MLTRFYADILASYHNHPETQILLAPSVSNATVIEFTVHCQIFVFISKCSGDIIISYMEVFAIVCTRIDFSKMFVMSLDFADVRNMSK